MLIFWGDCDVTSGLGSPGNIISNFVICRGETGNLAGTETEGFRLGHMSLRLYLMM